MIYEIENLEAARKYLKDSTDKIILTNPPGSTRYYGMRVIDYIFKTLQNEYPSRIQGVVVNAYDDYSAFTTARKLGYSQIEYLMSVNWVGEIPRLQAKTSV
jgi:phage baseplate assembly protein W